MDGGNELLCDDRRKKRHRWKLQGSIPRKKRFINEDSLKPNVGPLSSHAGKRTIVELSKNERLLRGGCRGKDCLRNRKGRKGGIQKRSSMSPARQPLKLARTRRKRGSPPKGLRMSSKNSLKPLFQKNDGPKEVLCSVSGKKAAFEGKKKAEGWGEGSKKKFSPGMLAAREEELRTSRKKMSFLEQESRGVR